MYTNAILYLGPVFWQLTVDTVDTWLLNKNILMFVFAQMKTILYVNKIQKYNISIVYNNNTYYIGRYIKNVDSA